MNLKGIKCPKCKKKLTRVSVYWEHYQRINLQDEEVEQEETIWEEPVDVECNKCSESIKDFCLDNEEIRDIIYGIA